MAQDAQLEVRPPSGNRTTVPLEPLPFLIGRQADNHLVLRDNRASRTHARILWDSGTYVVEDLKSRNGITVNHQRVERAALRNGDVIRFGVEDSYELVFRSEEQSNSLTSPPAGRLRRLRSLLEVARTMKGSLGIDHILDSLLESALAVTGCERGFVLLREGGRLDLRLGRDAHGAMLGDEDLRIPREVLRLSLERRTDLLAMTLEEYGQIVCVPLVRVAMTAAGEETALLGSVKDTAGLLFLESHGSRADLSGVNRELLQSLAVEASVILENARLLEQERERKKLEQDLQLARMIQRDLLPDQFPQGSWLRASGFSLTSAQVGGDYYDFLPTSEDRWAAVLADVSGKGVSSALLAAFLQGVFVSSIHEVTPATQVLDRINRFLLSRTGGEKYATLVLVTLERHGRIVWVNAGHCRPLLWRRSAEVFELDGAGMPVGMLEEARWDAYQQHLEPGDVLLLFTDGCSEAQNPSGEMFGTRRIGQCLAAYAPLGAEAVTQGLKAAVEAFEQNRMRNDDLTVLVLEYRGEHDYLEISPITAPVARA